MNRLIILVLMTSCLGICNAKKIVNSVWEKPEYQIADSIYFLDYKYDGKLLYLISNDKENLYIHAKITEKATQNMLLSNGLNVWIDTKAKGKEEMGIKYPLGNQQMVSDNSRSQRSATKDDSNALKLRIQAETDKFELVNFPDKSGILTLPVHDKEYITAKIEVNDKGELNYSLKIPYKSIALDYSPGLLISLNIEVENEYAGERPDNQSERPSSGGMQNMGGGGHSGGHSGGGRSGGGGGSRGDLTTQSRTSTQSSAIKIKIKSLGLK